MLAQVAPKLPRNSEFQRQNLPTRIHWMCWLPNTYISHVTPFKIRWLLQKGGERFSLNRRKTPILQVKQGSLSHIKASGGTKRSLLIGLVISTLEAICKGCGHWKQRKWLIGFPALTCWRGRCFFDVNIYVKVHILCQCVTNLLY